MGGTSMSRMDNRSKYTVHHCGRANGHSESKTLYPNVDHHINDGYHYVTHTLIVYDHKNRVIKSLQFQSGNDNQWEIRNHGVQLVKQYQHSKGVGSGRYLNWQIDNEDRYNNEDRAEENRRRQEEEQRRRDIEQRRVAEEQRRREEEERRRREEDEKRMREEAERRKREEEERRRREEEERRRREEEQRKQDVDLERGNAIAKEKYKRDMTESENRNSVVARQMEERRQAELVKQQKSTGWSTADKVETKKQLGDITIGERIEIVSEDEMSRARDFCSLLAQLGTTTDKAGILLAALKLLRPIDVLSIPKEILVITYHHILDVPRSSEIFHDGNVLETIVALFIQLCFKRMPVEDCEMEPMSEQAITQCLWLLPEISDEMDEDIKLRKTIEAIDVMNQAKENIYPLETFSFYFSKISQNLAPLDKILAPIFWILEKRECLGNDIELANFILRIKPSSEELEVTKANIVVKCIRSGVASQELVTFLEGIFIDEAVRIPKPNIIQYMSIFAEKGISLNPSLLEPICQYMTQMPGSSSENDFHALMIVLDAVLTAIGEISQTQRTILESCLSNQMDSNLIILKFACGWYLNDRIGFLDSLSRRLISLLNEEEYRSFVSSFLLDVAEKDITQLYSIDISEDIFNIAGQIHIHVQLAIILERLRGKIEVRPSVLLSILQTFKEGHNLSLDEETTNYCLQIFSTLIGVAMDPDIRTLNLEDAWLNRYLDHEVPEIRCSGFSLLTHLMRKENWLETNWKMYISASKKIFGNWDSVEEHRFASEYLAAVIPMMTKDEEEMVWKELHECIVDICLPSANAGHANLRADALMVITAWIDSAVVNSKFKEDDLLKIDKELVSGSNPSLHFHQQILTHLLGLSGHHLHEKCLTLLQVQAENTIPFESTELSDVQVFLTSSAIQLDLKESLVLNVLGKKLDGTNHTHTEPGYLDAIEILVEHGNPAVVKLFSEACSKFAVTARLPERSVLKILDILEDPRFKISIRKSAAKTIFYVLRIDKEILNRCPQFPPGILFMLKNVDMRNYGLFALCNLAVLPETNKNEIMKQIKNILDQGKKVELVTKESTGEETTNLRLCSFLLQKFDDNFPVTSGDDFNWMTEWLSIPAHVKDTKFILQDQAKYVRWLLKSEIPELVKQGQNMKIDVAITRIKFSLSNRTSLSAAESIVDKTLNYCKQRDIKSRLQDLLMLKGDLFMAQGHFKGAIKIFKTIGSVGVGLDLKIAKANLALGNYDRATKMFANLSSNNRFGLELEIQTCEKSLELYNLLKNLTKSRSLARAQLKGFHSKIGMSVTNVKQVNDVLSFLVERGEYYDLSVIATVDAPRWKIEFLAREIFNKATAGNAENRTWPEFYDRFKIMEAFHGGELLRFLESVLQLQTWNSSLGIDQILEIIFLLLTPDSHTTRIYLDDGNTEKLRGNWLKHKFHPVEVSELETVTFWTEVTNLKTTHSEYSELQLTFIEKLFDLTKVSNSFQDILDFLRFLGEKCVPFHDVQIFMGDLIIQGLTTNFNTETQQSSEGISLKQFQKDYDRNRFANEMSKIAETAHKLSDDLKTVVMETIKMFDEGVCEGEDAKAFLKYLVDLQENDQNAVIKRFFSVLAVDKAYKNVDLRPQIFHIVKEAETINWKEELRQSCLGELLASTGNEDKNVTSLVEEFRNDNHGNLNLTQKFEELEDFILKIERSRQSESSLGVSSGIPINEWDNAMIGIWAEFVKQRFRQGESTKEDTELVECFAVIQQAMHAFKGYCLRQVGVMALKLLLSSQDKGCLAKIATGEGKSGLVAALAVLKVLQGHTVDVVTNSSVLAQRDCDEWSPFFQMFGMTAMENSGIQGKPNVAKECYNQNIVYGDASAFQGDVLRHEFSLLGTRGNRKFDIVIVDEVDSMFIDGSNHSTRLIDKMPQMDYLEPIFAAIWQTVGFVSSTLAGIEGQTFAIGDVVGYSSNFIGCIVKSLQHQKHTLHIDKQKTITSESALRQAISCFCSEMQKQEMTDLKFRKQVVNLLQLQNLNSSLPTDTKEMLSGLKSLRDIKEDSPVVDSYIMNKWNLSDPKLLLNILKIYLDINIIIYANVEECIRPSPAYHDDDDISDSSNEKACLRFFQVGNEMFQLNYVENHTLFVARKVEETLRGRVISSSRVASKSKESKLVFPAHLFELFSTKLDEWIQSAIQAAFSMEENRNYVLRPNDMNKWNTITPVDFENTGVTQQSSVWGEGLHQFLQMKHKLKISPEYLATNFISNMSFFCRYGNSIYGLTGTLGDENEVDLLKELYAVDMIAVPTFKPKRYLELGASLAEDVNDWKLEIFHSTTREIENGRVVLIICRTIEDVKDLKTYLEPIVKNVDGSGREIDYRLYFRSDDAESESVIGGKMRSGTVVIATNLAGRGTNIKLTDEVIIAGGLHVIITFLPTNQRVEEQAVGRAARNGEPGTSQIILNLEMEEKFFSATGNEITIQNMKNVRGEIERQRVDKIRNGLAKELQIEEKLFKKFCVLKAMMLVARPMDPKKPDHILNGVGERWAVELETTKTRTDVLNWKKIDKDFDRFFDGLRSEVNNDNAIRNPSYYILQGNLHLLSEVKQEQSALELYTKGINLDKVFTQHAYYNRSFAKINQRKEGYKDDAKSDLLKAKDTINEHILPLLSAMHAMVDNKELTQSTPDDTKAMTFKAAKEDNDFTKQMVQKINFNYLQIKSIDEAIEKIDGSKRDVVAKFGDIKEFYAQNDAEIDYADIEEMEDNGFIRFMYVEEEPVPWWDIFAVFLLGVLQCVAGVCLCLIGATNIGAGLVAEGVSDFITGITAAVTGEFSWTDYLKNKALSIGVSLLLAGAGVALKAVAALPKVASIINAVKNSALVTKSISGVKAVGHAIKSAAKYAWKGTKSVASKAWTATKTAVSKAYGAFTNSSGVKWLTSTRPWIYSKNAFNKALTVVKDFSKNVWQKGKDFHTKIFGTKNLNPETYSNLKTAGQIIGREIAGAALMEGFDRSVLTAVGNAIEARIKSDTEGFHRANLLGSTTPTSQKINRVLQSCMGKRMDVQINNNVRKSLEDNSAFGQTVYRTFISQTSTAIFKALKGDRRATGWAGLGLHLIDHVTSLISNSVTIGESIKELAEMLPTLLENLSTELDQIEANISTHDHSSPTTCNGTSNPVDSRDLDRTITAYCTDWSTQLAKQMSAIIMANIIKPQTKVSVDEAWKIFSKGDEFEDFLEAKGQVNRNRLVAKNSKFATFFNTFGLPVHDPRKAPKNLDPSTEKSQDQNSTKPKKNSGDEGPEPVSEDQNSTKPKRNSGDQEPEPVSEDIEKLVKSKTTEEIPSLDSDQLLRFSSSRLDAAIELFLETEDGLKYIRSFGRSLGDKSEPVVVISKVSDDGLQTFSRLSTANGELNLAEFPVHKKEHQNASLLAALTSNASGNYNYSSMELELAEFAVATRPRPIKEFSVQRSFTNDIDERIVMCNYLCSVYTQ